MANQPELPTYDVGVYQLESTDPVDGGVGAVSNKPLLNLADRTAYLKQHVDNLESGATIPPGIAPLNSPALTGTPTTPTAPLGDNSTKIANTAFVQGTVNGISSINVAGSSNVILTAVQAGAGILAFSGALTGNIDVIVPNTSAKWAVSNQTTGAFTLRVKTAAGSGIYVAQGKNTLLGCDGVNVQDVKTDFPSPALTGNPTAPTAASGDNSTSISNTGFVFNATDGLAGINVAGNVDVTLSQAQYGSAILNLTGALTGNINLKFPQQSGQWIVANNSTGAFAITAKTTAAGGGTTVLPQGSAVIVYSDGTNMYFASSGGQTSLTRTQFTPAAGTTSLTVATGYTAGNLIIEKNGTVLEPADFTATNGSTITLTPATTAGDVINVYAFKTFTVANAVLKSGDTMAGPLALFGGDTGTTAAQFDNSTKLATTAFLRAAGEAFGGIKSVAAAATLDSTYAGQLTIFSGSSYTVTLPAASSYPSGSALTFESIASGSVSVQRAGADFIVANNLNQTLTAWPLTSGDSLTLVSDGSSKWYTQAGSAVLNFSNLFAQSTNASGYKKLPGGIIIQWGSVTSSTSASVTATFPIAFPNACLSVSAVPWVGGAGSFAAVESALGTTGFSVGSWVSNTTRSSAIPVFWTAIGY